MRPLALTLAVALLATCSDDGGPQECTPDLSYAYQAGSLWGPCTDAGSCDQGACRNPGAVMLDDGSLFEGNMCTPASCPSTGHPDCGRIEGDSITGCFHSCDSDLDCVDGSVCADGVCLWPLE